MDNWQAQDQSSIEYIGLIELENNEYFEIYKNDTHLIFGSHCNIGLLESGNFIIDNCFSIDENLSELISDLECFYNNESTSDNFTCNDRM